MTEEKRQALRELIENRIEHRKSEEKYFGAKYEREYPFAERTGSVTQYAKAHRAAKEAHMAEYDRRMAYKPSNP